MVRRAKSSPLRVSAPNVVSQSSMVFVPTLTRRCKQKRGGKTSVAMKKRKENEMMGTTFGMCDLWSAVFSCLIKAMFGRCGLWSAVFICLITAILGMCGLLSVVFICLIILIVLFVAPSVVRHRRCTFAVGVGILIFGCCVYMQSPSNDNVLEAGRADVTTTNSMRVCTNACVCTKVWLHTRARMPRENIINDLLGAASSSLSAFYPSRGAYENARMASLYYWLFHLLAILYITVILVAFFGIELVNQFYVRALCQLDRLQVNVFWDSSEEAKTLAESIGHRLTTIFIISERNKPWPRLDNDESPALELIKKQWTWIFGEPSEPSFLASATDHFFLGPNGHENVVAAEKLLEVISRECDNKERKIYVRIGAKADDDVLYKWADAWNKKAADSKVEIIVVREESLVSKKFLLDHSMLDCPNISIDYDHAFVRGEFRILILGFGVLGERLMNDMICDAQYLAGKNGKRVPVSVDVVDYDPAAYGWFKANCKTACSRFSINFLNIDATTEEFWDWLKSQEMYSRIVVCTQDDRINIRVASEIAKLCKIRFHEAWAEYADFARRLGSPQALIYARIRNADIHQYVKSTIGMGGVDFLPFGCMGETYTTETLFSDKWDKGAKWMVGIYATNTKEGEVPSWSKAEVAWKTTTTFNRESSRASLFYQRNLLRLIGCQIAGTGIVDDGMDKDAVKRMALKKKDELAEDEHLRWMAFHYVRGIECWSPSEEDLKKIAKDRLSHYSTATEEKKSKYCIVSPNLLLQAKDGAVQRNLHADLVEFDELPKVDDLFNAVNKDFGFKSNSDQQNKDFDLTLGLESILEAGFRIEKTKSALGKDEG